MKTWGKLAVLRGFCRLRDAGCLDVISEAVIETMKQKTDYGDFFDKETMSLRGYPTNYLQVAMACAGYQMCIRDRLYLYRESAVFQADL